MVSEFVQSQTTLTLKLCRGEYYNDTRMSTIQLNTPEKTQKSANFASKNSMKILAVKRGKCLAKPKEWGKKSKKSRKRKRRVKVNFAFCTVYLPDLH